MYGNHQYGVNQYAQEDKQKEITDKYSVDLAHYVPKFISEINEFKVIYQAQGEELGIAKYEMDDVLLQPYLTSATWALSRWEKVWGINTNLSLSYEERREIVLAKLRGQGTTTRGMVKNTAEAFSGGEVDVIEDNPHHCFIVRFIGVKGIPRNMQAFIAMLEDVKPAHLAYKIEYTYTVWNNLKSMTWYGISDKTYDTVKIMKGA